jgi:hypothetical protein
LRGHCSMYVRTTTACSVSSTSSHTDPANVPPPPSPYRHLPARNATGARAARFGPTRRRNR